MSQIVLWVTDPWNTLAHSQDTTLRLIQEAERMGVPSYWSASDTLLNSLSPDRFHAVAARGLAGPDSTKEVELEPSKIHQIHYRVDPPVDFNYLSLLEEIVRRVGREETILNPPSILRDQSEKVPPPSLSHLVPLSVVVDGPVTARAAWERFQGHTELVSKPLNEAQSKGVKRWPVPTSFIDWEQALAADTKDFSQPVILQEYLPGIAQGEVRMWFAAGEFIASLKKFPKNGDFRVLIDEGSKIEAHHLSLGERAVAEEVGATLKRQRVALAAIDFISGKISDYNITSPGLLVQMEQVHGQNFARGILERIL